MAKVISKEKQTGATFTPSILADYLANQIGLFLNFTDNQSILDPACGDGELLFSITRATNANINLFGFDLNQEYVEKAKQIDDDWPGTITIEQGDFIQKDLEGGQQMFDAIIANPPYVRTQVLGGERAQFLAKKYNLKGRVDLYYPFLIAMTNHLKVGGIIGVITSNKYLFTKSGKSIREYLSRNYEILKVMDLGDTKLFPNAAVLPAIFIGKKINPNLSKQKLQTRFIKIYEDKSKQGKVKESIIHILNEENNGSFIVENKSYSKSTGTLYYSSNSGEVWSMMSDDEMNWAKRIEDSSMYLIKDFVKVRVGIKSNGDPIFIRDDWHKLEIVPESKLLKPIISNHDFNKWQSKKDISTLVLYPHFAKNGKKGVINLDDYPNAKNYLLPYKETLEKRTYLIEAKRNWYELWVPQNPEYWPKPKLIFPDICDEAKFFYDDSGAIVNGNCYWISGNDLANPDLLFLIQGVCNSKVIGKYHDLKFNNRLYAGRRRYFSQYIENYPIPDPNSKISQEIITVVKELNKASYNSNSIKSLENKLNSLVEKAFNV